MTTVYVTVYLLHPKIALDILASFSCVSVRGTGTSYMRGNMSIDCSSASYHSYLAIAIVYFIVYIVGGVLFICWRMRVHKEDLILLMQGNSTDNHDAGAYLYFARGYKRETYLWEAAVIFRKVFIVGCSALIISSGLQLAWSGAILAISVGATILNKPFDSVVDNRLDTVALYVLIYTVMLGFHSLFAGGSAGSQDAIFALLVIGNVLTFVYFLSVIFTRAHKKVLEDRNDKNGIKAKLRGWIALLRWKKGDETTNDDIGDITGITMQSRHK
jgi:hypothetical protein